MDVIAGPCSVESEEQICEIARRGKRQALLFSAGVHSSRELPLTLSKGCARKELSF